MLTTKEFPASQLPYAAIVLVEPTIVTRELFNAHVDDRMESMKFAVSATSVRRDKWDTREVAFSWLSKRFPWNRWDPRVVRLLTVSQLCCLHLICIVNITSQEYGLQETASGVILKCDRNQEAASYPDVEGHFESATLLSRVCHILPVHIIWGDGNDLVSVYVTLSP
jgi:hypothetical protein